MDTDQEGDQVQRGVAVPCLVIFAAAYVLGVFLGCFLLQREYQLELSTALGWALMIPLVFAPLWVLGYFQHYGLSVLEPIIFFVVFSLLVWRLYLSLRKKVPSRSSFVVLSEGGCRILDHFKRWKLRLAAGPPYPTG